MANTHTQRSDITTTSSRVHPKGDPPFQAATAKNWQMYVVQKGVYIYIYIGFNIGETTYGCCPFGLHLKLPKKGTRNKRQTNMGHGVRAPKGLEDSGPCMGFIEGYSGKVRSQSFPSGIPLEDVLHVTVRGMGIIERVVLHHHAVIEPLPFG